MNNTQKEIKAIEDKIRKTIKEHEETLEKINDSDTRNFMNGVIAGLRRSLLCFPLLETIQDDNEKEYPIKVEYGNYSINKLIHILNDSYYRNKHKYDSFEKMVNIYAKDDFYKLHYVAQTYLEERKKQLK